MKPELIARINELAAKHKSHGLTEEEMLERETLRKAYIEEFRAGFKQKLDNLYFVDEKGNKIKATKKK